MRLKRTLAATCALALLCGQPLLAHADYDPPQKEEKIRLAIAYGSTSEQEAQECATRLHMGPGMHHKMNVPEDCSWMPITADEVLDAWAGSSSHPGITLLGIIHGFYGLWLRFWTQFSAFGLALSS